MLYFKQVERFEKLNSGFQIFCFSNPKSQTVLGVLQQLLRYLQHSSLDHDGIKSSSNHLQEFGRVLEESFIPSRSKLVCSSYLEEWFWKTPKINFKSQNETKSLRWYQVPNWLVPSFNRCHQLSCCRTLHFTQMVNFDAKSGIHLHLTLLLPKWQTREVRITACDLQGPTVQSVRRQSLELLFWGQTSPGFRKLLLKTPTKIWKVSDDKN